MRRFLTVIVVLVLLLVIVDRAAVWFAQRTIADEIQRSEDLAARPDVSVSGFPFLTQVLGGKYKEVDVKLVNPAVDGGLTIDTLDIQLKGVRIALGDAMKQQIDSVPVDAATATAFVSFTALNEAAKANLPDTKSTVQFGPADGGMLGVTGNYRSSGLSAKLDLTARVLAKDGDLVVELPASTLDGLPSVVRPQVKSLVTQASRLPSLPFGFQARKATVGPTGITVEATSASLNLER
jgi:hypothetical protein